MWLLENQGNIFEGRRLWLRPGKLYLFGRTASEPGQLAISDKTISRKHLTIQVDNVPEGDGRNLNARSQVTIHDLETKKGTVLNGEQIRGETRVFSQDVNEIKMGLCSKLFRITWQPVVFSFSFTSKELRNDPWAKLREDLEQLDIKYSAEYERALTSHVITKKRNTSKGLQALINGKYLVTDSFVNAVIEAATSSGVDQPGNTSALEQDYDGNWPNALEHLPPRGEEPGDLSEEDYAPNESRREVFDGYTFVFYEKKQYDNLFSAITSGKGKALFTEVTPGQTEIDDFIRYVKGVAGEKGLGSFEDGSEGRGVVVVRYLPAKGGDFDWFAEFLTSVALRLDHRPIDQREFIEAILACDASMLRRPLEEESQPESALARPPRATTDDSTPMDVVEPEPESAPEPVVEEAAPAPPARRGRTRRGVASRFKGFDLDTDTVDTMMTGDSSAPAPSQDPLSALASAPTEAEPGEQPRTTRRTQRKRGHSLDPEGDTDMMEGIAPTAAAVKRRRVEAGEEAVPASAPEPEPAEDVVSELPTSKTSRSQSSRLKKKGKENIDILELARQHREEAEARAAAERDALNNLPDDGIDYAAIRALQIVEECTVHIPDQSATRSRERDIKDGRWDPSWNGRQNFKKFRKQGEPAGRPAPRVIVGLEEVKAKEYGIGDDYWLEDEGAGKKKDGHRESQSQPATQSQARTGASKPKGKEKENNAPPRRRAIAIDSSDEEGSDDHASSTEPPAPAAPPEPELPRTRTAKTAERANTRLGQTRSQQQQQQSQEEAPSQKTQATKAGKRAAAAPPAGAKAAKKPRKVVEIHDSDDSDDGPRFRFGRR